MLAAEKNVKPAEIDIICCGGISFGRRFLLNVCLLFRPDGPQFFMYFSKDKDAGMFVKWAEKYLCMQGALIGCMTEYCDLPEPVIYVLAAEQRQAYEASRLPPPDRPGAWL